MREGNEVYEKSLILRDFKRPGVYQSLAACYAQTGAREEAFFRLYKMLAVGWLDDEELKKDADLKTLFTEPRGKKFLAKLEKAKIQFAKEISPATYGVAENPAMRKIEWRSKDPKISAEEFFRLVSNFSEFPQPKKTGVFVKFTNHFSEKIPPRRFTFTFLPATTRPHSLLVYSAGSWVGREKFCRTKPGNLYSIIRFYRLSRKKISLKFFRREITADEFAVWRIDFPLWQNTFAAR